MADNAPFKLHHPRTFAARDTEDLRKGGHMMDRALEDSVARYQDRPLNVAAAGQHRMIDDETWLPAPQAKDHGFVAEV
ncbi:head maturation protease, ClpP-related, partial [Pseudomonas aeruginosa]